MQELACRDLRLIDLLHLFEPDLEPASCKVHLAVHTKVHDPLEVYLAGDFDRWQCEQNGRNFECDYVIGLIQTPVRHRWLFAGLYRSHGCQFDDDSGRFEYEIKRLDSGEQLAGRLMVEFQRPGRQSYLWAARWLDTMKVCELRADRLRVADFPGYANVRISKATLDLIVAQNIESWRVALSAVAGVYLISDSATGKLYVGSACGQLGIWQRWASYSATGHGGNRDLKALLEERGQEYSDHFQFSILEIADTHASNQEIVAREQFWKEALWTREHGYNAN